MGGKKQSECTDKKPVKITTLMLFPVLMIWRQKGQLPSVVLNAVLCIQILCMMPDVIIDVGEDEKVAVVVTLREPKNTIINTMTIAIFITTQLHNIYNMLYWTSTDLLKPQSKWNLLFWTGSYQIVRKQLTGSQELVLTALIDQNIQLRTSVWLAQNCSIILLWSDRRVQ